MGWHVWKSQNPLLWTVLEQNPIGKRRFERSKMRWKDVVMKGIEALGGGPNRSFLAVVQRQLENWL